MPVLTVYRHGSTAGVPPMSRNHHRGKRGEVNGWTPGAVRRNLAFLRSVDERRLTGEGWAITLTVRDCPPTHEDWRRLVELYLLQLRRQHGALRAHWVTEWQRRGVPHLHGAIWLPEGPTERFSVSSVFAQTWLNYAAPYRAGSKGQTVKIIDGVVGWFQYVSKHLARGVKHYQRSSDNIPQGWVKTGRMWGHNGDWPLREPVKLQLNNRGYHILRRWARSWRVADARAGHAQVAQAVSQGGIHRAMLQAYADTRQRISSARTMLRCPDPSLSSVRGISEWISEDLIFRMLQRLSLDGYSVES